MDLAELDHYANHHGYPEDLPSFSPIARKAKSHIIGLQGKIDRLTAENEKLRAALKGIAEYCSGDGMPLGAIERLAAIRNTATRAIE